MGLLRNGVSGVFLLLCFQKKPVKLDLSGILPIRNGPGPIKTGFSRFQCIYIQLLTYFLNAGAQKKISMQSQLCHLIFAILW